MVESPGSLAAPITPSEFCDLWARLARCEGRLTHEEIVAVRIAIGLAETKVHKLAAERLGVAA